MSIITSGTTSNIKVWAGMFTTGTAALASWITTLNDYGQFGITVLGIIVGILTAWYTYERAMKMRTERLKEQT